MSVRLVASGLGFTEGPLWTSRGTLMLVSMSRGLVHEIDVATGEASVAASPGGAPSGLAEDADGAIWIAQGGGRGGEPSIQRYAGGRIETMAAGGLTAPNDLTFGPDGGLWFTDPSGPAIEGTPEPGSVWRLDRRSSAMRVMIEGPYFPNGLAFLPDGSLLVAETFTGRILRHDPARTGAPLPVFAQLPAGRPDGLAVDAELNVYAAATSAAGVQVFDAAGRPTEMIAVAADAFPTNVCFGGADGRTLFVTSPKGGSVFAVERPLPGLPLWR